MAATLVIPETTTMISLEEAVRACQRMLPDLLRDAMPELLRRPDIMATVLSALAAQGIKPCAGSCSTLPAQMGDCSIDTRLSFSRKTNLKRQNGDEFAFSDNMPIQPGQSVEYQIPSFPLGRVIECFYFRPTMGAGGNPDEIKVTITGDDGVLWKTFRGGRHMSNGCCLLECFADDCIGWNEGFRVILEHTGAIGQPALLSAVADWQYLFPGCTSQIKPAWLWPKGRCGSSCG